MQFGRYDGGGSAGWDVKRDDTVYAPRGFPRGESTDLYLTNPVVEE